MQKSKKNNKKNILFWFLLWFRHVSKLKRFLSARWRWLRFRFSAPPIVGFTISMWVIPTINCCCIYGRILPTTFSISVGLSLNQKCRCFIYSTGMARYFALNRSTFSKNQVFRRNSSSSKSLFRDFISKGMTDTVILFCLSFNYSIFIWSMHFQFC